MKKILLSLTTLCITTFTIAQVDLKKGLVAHYPLDGNAIDSSSNALNGTISGAVSDSGHKGKPNTALKFDGVNDYVEVSHNNKLNLTTDKSISVWYKITTTSGITLYPSLVYKQGQTDFSNFAIFFSEDPAYGSNRLKIGFQQGDGSTNQDLFTKEKYTDYLNQWVHIIGTYSRSDGYMRIYFNGKLSDSLSAPNYTSLTSTDPMQIGRGNKINFNGNYFKGSLDEVRLYDRALTKEEVSALFKTKVFLRSNTSISICNGDSALIRGTYRTQAGSYTDTVNVSANTDSIYTTVLTVNTINTNVTQNAGTLTATSDSATYQWIDCNNNNNPIMGETAKQFIATANGNYAVVITKNGCTDTSNCLPVVGLSARDNTFKQSVTIYPTPAKNWVKVNLGKVYNSIAVTLFTIEGKKLNTLTTTNNSSIKIPTSAISAGTYLLEIIADGNKTSSKVVIED